METIALTLFYFVSWAQTDWAIAWLGFWCLLFASITAKEIMS
jgi:hypothetical protein